MGLAVLTNLVFQIAGQLIDCRLGPLRSGEGLTGGSLEFLLGRFDGFQMGLLPGGKLLIDFGLETLRHPLHQLVAQPLGPVDGLLKSGLLSGRFAFGPGDGRRHLFKNGLEAAVHFRSGFEAGHQLGHVALDLVGLFGEILGEGGQPGLGAVGAFADLLGFFDERGQAPLDAGMFDAGRFQGQDGLLRPGEGPLEPGQEAFALGQPGIQCSSQCFCLRPVDNSAGVGGFVARRDVVISLGPVSLDTGGGGRFGLRHGRIVPGPGGDIGPAGTGQPGDQFTGRGHAHLPRRRRPLAGGTSSG